MATRMSDKRDSEQGKYLGQEGALDNVNRVNQQI